MKDFRFWAKLSIFFLPFLILIAVVWLQFAKIGDVLPMREIIYRQQTDSIILYQPSWQRLDTINYKLLASLSYQPEIAVIGSSRAELVYSEIFNLQPESFYNMAVPAVEISDIYQMLRYLEAQNALPTYLFFQIDFPRFTGPFRESVVEGEYSHTLIDELSFVFRKTKDALTMLFYQRSLFEHYLLMAEANPGIIGTRVLGNSGGYRNDGSIFYHNIEANIEQTLEDQAIVFENKELWFRPGDTLDEETFSYIEAIIEIAQRNEMLLIGYVPPMRKTFYELLSSSEEYSYIEPGMNRLEQLFNAYNMPLFDFREMDSFGSSDEEFFDSWHPGILANARMYHVMLSQLPELSEYVDLNQLYLDIERSPDNFYPFGREP